MVIQEINRLRREKNGVILAHNYQLGEIQDIADITGDSLELAKKSRNLDYELIVFCGVYFMAETAKILSPDKKVVMPRLDAGCPLADMIDPLGLTKLKEENPGAKVVCYVNSTAQIKALSDVCCTSANAVDVVKKLDAEKIIFVPDQNLGYYVKSKVKDKEIILWPGFCPTHHRLTKDMILEKKRVYKDAIVVVHPECNHEVQGIADEIASTGGMARFVKKSGAKEFIIGTEIGMLHRLKKENPDKKFYIAADNMICPNMKKITLASVRDVLLRENNVIKVQDDLREKALVSINEMFRICGF